MQKGIKGFKRTSKLKGFGKNRLNYKDVSAVIIHRKMISRSGLVYGLPVKSNKCLVSRSRVHHQFRSTPPRK